jgi:DNA-binding NtrC family response regulator
VDVPALVHHFIRKKTAELGLGRTPDLAPAAIERLLAYPWPGNVRELENTVERALILGQGRPLTFADLIPGYRAESVFASAPVESPLAADLHQPEPDRLDEVEARHIRRVLAFTQGRVEGEKGAARILGLNPGTLRHRMRKLGVPFGRKVKE